MEDLIDASSIVFPIRINEIIYPPVSRNIKGCFVDNTAKIKEERLPIEINVSILKLNSIKFFIADT